MTTIEQDIHLKVHPRRQLLSIALAVIVTIPGIALRFWHADISHALAALGFGAAIVGAAFLLAWAAETAQLDISAGLAIAILAFIAVLPEYAVDMVFAWKGGKGYAAHGPTCSPAGDTHESPCSLALANMTGSNRLLIGIGWSLVVALAYWQWRRRRMPDRAIRLDRARSIDLSYLAIATAYAMTLPLKRSLTLIDAVVLVAVFVAYTVRLAGAPAEEPHLVGPARVIGSLSAPRRRGAVAAMLVFAGAVILLCAESFAEALVQTGQSAGIDEFLLVQWVAPLASETPELLVAALYAWRLNTSAGLGTLVSSKVNQWTLLVGTLPIVFAIASGSLHGLPLGTGQREELLLTGAQAVFAVAVLASLTLSVKEGVLLFVLFWAQFIIGALVPERLHGVERVGVSAMYLLLGAWILLRDRSIIRSLLRDGIRTPHLELNGDGPITAASSGSG